MIGPDLFIGQDRHWHSFRPEPRSPAFRERVTVLVCFVSKRMDQPYTARRGPERRASRPERPAPDRGVPKDAEKRASSVGVTG